MATFNSLLGTATALIMSPMLALPAWVSLLLWSLLSAIVILLIFRITSNQERMAEAKRAIHACLFEIRLFNDDLGKIFRAQGEILRHNMTYLRLTLVPMIWILPVLTLLMSQLHPYYGYQEIEPGAPTILTVELAPNPQTENAFVAHPEISLEVPEGIRVDSPSVWVPGRHELSWRIVAEKPGRFELAVATGDKVVTKALAVANPRSAKSPTRVAGGFVDQLIHPIEPLLPTGCGIESITIRFADGSVNVLGLDLHWLIHFFVLSIVFAFALRKPLGVTI